MPLLVEPAEPAVTGVVGTLAKDRVEPAGVEIGMKLRADGIGKAVRRPRRDVIRMVGEMVTGIDMEILRGHHVAVIGAAVQVCADGAAPAAAPPGHSQ